MAPMMRPMFRSCGKNGGSRRNARAAVFVTVLQPVRRLFHISGHAVDVDDIREPDIRPFKAT